MKTQEAALKQEFPGKAASLYPAHCPLILGYEIPELKEALYTP